MNIHGSANRMNGLIEAVLIYSNVASDTALFLPTDLNLIVQEVLEDLELTITSTNSHIQIDRLPVIDAIPIQMRQLFQNLISNAIKYSKADCPPEIKISCINTEKEYKITIEDNGIGFENAYAEKIFLVFQRLLNDKSYEGTGIGLAVCKKIIEAHNGKINAESTPGVGSKFTIHLPKAREHAAIQQA